MLGESCDYMSRTQRRMEKKQARLVQEAVRHGQHGSAGAERWHGDVRLNEAGSQTNLGNALRENGRLSEAIACYRRAIGLKPDLAEAHSNLGNALQEQGRADEAVPCLLTALRLKPDYAHAHNNLGNAYKDQGHLEKAAACYRTAIGLAPDYAHAHNNLGNTLWEQGHLDEAGACFRTAVRLMPDYAHARSNLGSALEEQGLLEEAASSLRAAIEIAPGYAHAHNNLANVLRRHRRLHEAVACYAKALEIQPDHAEAHFSLGTALLAQGHLAAGWAEYEWRWKTLQMAPLRRDVAQPQWRGEAAAGQTLLMHAEQGFGDTLQFCRYAGLAAARGLRVVMQVQAPLVRLLRTLPGIDRVVGPGEDLPAFDLHCPMLSMPLALGTTVETIPSAASYLRADETQAAAWRERLAASDIGGLRVGLVWAGDAGSHSPTQAATDRRRSLPPALLAPLIGLPGLRFFSLQKLGAAAPVDLPVSDFMAEMGDFADTAALVANLDLVISVDTAVAHLASALGKPVWLLDRYDACWRWLDGRRDSPWYPALRLYRQQSPGDWVGVLAAVARDLEALRKVCHPSPGR